MLEGRDDKMAAVIKDFIEKIARTPTQIQPTQALQYRRAKGGGGPEKLFLFEKYFYLGF